MLLLSGFWKLYSSKVINILIVIYSFKPMRWLEAFILILIAICIISIRQQRLIRLLERIELITFTFIYCSTHHNPSLPFAHLMLLLCL